jgi:CarD family transcriptional regulator
MAFTLGVKITKMALIVTRGIEITRHECYSVRSLVIILMANSEASMGFKVGDLAVYPGYGVGRVVSIETQDIMGTSCDVYRIELLENKTKVIIPTASATKKGLRHVISCDEASQVMNILRDVTPIRRLDNQTWNRRHREYMEKIKTGSVFEIAQVLRELFLLKVGKELSFGERKMLDTARCLLIKELSLATNCDEPSMESQVREIFN